MPELYSKPNSNLSYLHQVKKERLCCCTERRKCRSHQRVSDSTGLEYLPLLCAFPVSYQFLISSQQHQPIQPLCKVEAIKLCKTSNLLYYRNCLQHPSKSCICLIKTANIKKARIYNFRQSHNMQLGQRETH